MALPTPQDMRLVTEGAATAALLPHIQAETDVIVDAVMRKAITELRAGKLEPQQALNYWREIDMAQRYLKSFKTRVAVGRSTAEDIDLEL